MDEKTGTCIMEPRRNPKDYVGDIPYQSALDQSIRDLQFPIGLPSAYRLIHLMERPENFLLTHHAHSWYHVNYLFQGSVEIYFQDDVYTAHEGEVFILPPYIPHQLRSATGYSQLGIDVVLAEDSRGISQMVQQTFGREITIMSISSLYKTFDELYEMMIGRSDFDLLRLINFAEGMLYDLIDIRRVGRNITFKNKFQEMLHHINPYSTTLDEMASWLSLSKTQLERLCRKEFGCGAIEYCAKLKCARSCMLLQASDKGLREIAEELCFYDESHFSVFFKRYMGITPGQYRRSFRKRNGRIENFVDVEAALLQNIATETGD